MTFDKMYGHEGFLAKRFLRGRHITLLSQGKACEVCFKTERTSFISAR